MNGDLKTNDVLKTFIFFLVALLTLIPAVYLSLPEKEGFSASEMVEQILFPELKGVMDISTFSVCQAEKNGSLSRLEIKKTNGQWILLSFSGYPANAQNRMVEVALALKDLRVLRVVGDDVATRIQCGVMDPEDTQNSEPKDCGKRIVIRNQKDQVLLDLILGRELEEGSGRYYARRSRQNPVYVVEIDPSKISARFIDWIETDLLKVQPSDIASLYALDCSLDLHTENEAPTFNHRGQFMLAQHYLENPDWTVVSNQRMFGNGLRDIGVPAGKTLDLPLLRRVCQALADMRISSVQRKPSGMSEAFRRPENIELTEEQNRQLQKSGFCVLPMNLGNGLVNALFSSDGQVHVYSTNGIVYRLFFGGVAGQEALEDFEKLEERKFYRYLLLTADLYPQGIEQPKLMELPPKPDDSADEATKAQYQSLLEMNAQEQRVYEEKLADARKRVDEMNALFADWFFIIPDDVYRQIHLTSENVFISQEEAEKRKQSESAKEKNAEKDERPVEECADPNCPEHCSHEECSNPDCPTHHARAENEENEKDDSAKDGEERGSGERDESQENGVSPETSGTLETSSASEKADLSEAPVLLNESASLEPKTYSGDGDSRETKETSDVISPFDAVSETETVQP